MKTIFKNKLTQGGTKKRESGHAIIAESKGVWIGGWSSNDPDKIEEPWYEGKNWEDLLAAFRKGLAEKVRQGFRPELEMGPRL